MDFNTLIAWSGKFYNILKKLNLDHKIDLDYIIDNNYPEVLSKMLSYSGVAKIAVCATNGKKTTLNFLNQIFECNSNLIITNLVNDKNSCYYDPALTAILLNLSKSIENYGNIPTKDFYTLCMDEFEIAQYFNLIRFDYLLLSNLFSEQKDFCSVKEKIKKIKEAIVFNPKVNLIINADEPYFHEIDNIDDETTKKQKRNKFFYGFESVEFFGNEKLIQKNDLTRCPNCGCKLDYSKRYYSHLGHYNCECSFKRPKLDLSAKAKIFNDYSFLEIYHNQNKIVFRVPIGGLYNAYNALGAIAVALNCSIERKIISKAFEEYLPLIARDEIVKIQDRKIKIKVIKNQVALSEAAKEAFGSKKTKVVFCLNDDIQDGIDTSWIWDSNLNSFKNFENKVYVSSNRFDDMALRLKYAGVNPCLIIMHLSVKSAIECCYFDADKEEEILILTVPSLIKSVKQALKQINPSK